MPKSELTTLLQLNEMERARLEKWKHDFLVIRQTDSEDTEVLIVEVKAQLAKQRELVRNLEEEAALKKAYKMLANS
ncbi:hypothetical protein [Cohnella sp. AR92]|uniref:hypothetical protein n=1 Tax=Cohnella sp. AR92 TaxID=648716 RepID=UPI000F8F6CCB|nr:hypothetical protein [Cohnella sp. AR92]RUS48594.1 hypothetical protein ELR57_04060 [Cohnella sp. AR92]